MQMRALMMAAGACGLLWAGSAAATTQVLADGNTVAIVETESDGDDPAGMVSWVVDGTEHLFYQWFFVRVDGDDFESPVDALGLVGEQVSDTNAFDDPSDDTLAVRYSSNQLRVDLSYTLRGGSDGSGQADVAELIRITNLTNESLSVSFFQYSDFDLDGTEVDASVEVLNPNTVRQSDSSGSLTETVVTPAPDLSEVGSFDDTIVKLTDLAVDDLDGSTGPLTDSDLTWALQWNFVLDPRGSYLISKDKQIRAVAEPATLALAGLLAAGALARRRS